MHEHANANPLLPELAAMNPAELATLLERQQNHVTDLRVLGADHTEAHQNAAATLAELAPRAVWSKQRQILEPAVLWQQANRPLLPTDYAQTITRYAQRAASARQADDQELTLSQTNYAKRCLQRSAVNQQWSKQHYHAEQAKLQAALDAPVVAATNLQAVAETPRESRLQRMRNKLDYLGMLAVTKINNVPETTPAQQRKRRLVMSGLGALAGSVFVGYAAWHGHHISTGATQHTAVGLQPQPVSGTGSSDNLRANGLAAVPAPRHAAEVPLQQTGPGLPAPHNVQLPATTETVRANDTVWTAAKHRLGSDASDKQINAYVIKIFAANHLTNAKAHLLRVGSKLILPRV